ncbi:hypothetical protein ELI20_01120 [Rhizobium ruizarguesonis]|jgi:hypothetical protein|uniref:hypothetical protein n=1 Tax=Rhizobium TaxID=379 RepID=UPI0010313FDF|nr:MULTISPECIES: hypothetical protein [Rhizobium]QIO58726.1 hypothetical protein HA463_13960 [Rhizobium leguminosarum bv. trifolii]TAU77937.1 hypothetical protein ELI46_18590 [Rhizobium ruizarguesonis]TAW19918.1 hypothetical protein ELI20_01120 [Rhizobium ruizarguesonis]TBC33794.1 hypothetical protein ELH33_01090 [Rhizobium ruizarguesonis]
MGDNIIDAKASDGHQQTIPADGTMLEVKPLVINNNVMFLFAVIVLIAILGAGYWRDDLQYNLMFLISLSLSCSIVFAFLPFSAEVGLEGWLKAGGTAAIFAVCLWQTVPFAKEMLKDNRVLEQKLHDIELAKIDVKGKEDLIKQKDQELNQLRSALEKATGQQGMTENNIRLIEQNINSANNALATISPSLVNAMNSAKAAQSNYSDSKTCSLRASQSIEALAPAFPAIETLGSALKTARAAIQPAQ